VAAQLPPRRRDASVRGRRQRDDRARSAGTRRFADDYGVHEAREGGGRRGDREARHLRGRESSMIAASARTMRCYALDAPGESLEDTLSYFDFLVLDAAPRLPTPLDELSFALNAAWLRTFWTPRDLRGLPWWRLFGADHAWWT